jgi:uncharacterized lipoprotein YddW (UPF0748 family)
VRQLRGLWITTVRNTDWPKPAGRSVDEQKKQYIGLLDAAQRNGINAVFVHIRPQADSFYPGAPEPWSKWLTGIPGKDPGYDALGFCLAEAQRRNLEFHAWFNPYRMGEYADPSQLPAGHPVRDHPDWSIAFDKQLYYNPGIPEARRFVINAIMDAVHKYDVDGVHFDDYFYPYPVKDQPFPDQDTFARYGGGYSNLGDWRRSNINRFVREVSERVADTKPWVRFGISPFGIWRNSATDPVGSDTNGLQSYDEIYADTRLWVKKGWLDYIAPQLYWKLDDAKAAYSRLLPWWAKTVAGTDTALYIGQAAYRLDLAAADPVWRDPTELVSHLDYNRSYHRVAGDIWFDTTHFLASSPNLSGALAANAYRHPALIPVSNRIHGSPPPPPSGLHANASAATVALSWNRTVDKSTRYYAIYRFDAASPDRSSALGDGGSLLGTVRRNEQPPEYVDTTVDAGITYTYAVTALDRSHRQSRPGPSISVTAR